MIRSFKHKGLKRLYERGDASRLDQRHVTKITAILSVLDCAEVETDLDLPLWHVHRLTGDLANLWSMRVSANWRIVFRLDEAGISDVDLIDYH